MEERLNDWSAAQYKEALARKTDEMAMPFKSKATKLDGKKCFFLSYVNYNHFIAIQFLWFRV